MTDTLKTGSECQKLKTKAIALSTGSSDVSQLIDLTGVAAPDDDHVSTLPDGTVLVVDDDE